MLRFDVPILLRIGGEAREVAFGDIDGGRVVFGVPFRFPVQILRPLNP